MINKVSRRILHKLLGDEKYLTLVSKVFLKMYHTGRARKKYPEIYLLNKLISEGSTCIDIGANLGYYTIPLAELAGSSGKVYSIEPIPLFLKILKKNIERYKVSDRVEFIPYALGEENDKEITMVTPSVEGLVHFGYTKIKSPDDKNIFHSYSVKMFTPQALFGNIDSLHFIKCDVEGYEKYVIPGFLELIKKFKPVLQVEICPVENRKLIIGLLKPHGYNIYYFDGEKLIGLKEFEDNLENNCDLYFLNSSKIQSFDGLIAK